MLNKKILKKLSAMKCIKLNRVKNLKLKAKIMQMKKLKKNAKTKKCKKIELKAKRTKL
jgi:hypothetical protein